MVGRAELDKMRENVRQSAIRAVDRKGYVTSHDVAEELSDVSLTSASNYLGWNCQHWGLTYCGGASIIRDGHLTGSFATIYARSRDNAPREVDLTGKPTK